MLLSSKVTKLASSRIANTAIRDGMSYGRVDSFLKAEAIQKIAATIPCILEEAYTSLPDGVSVVRGTDGKAKVTVKHIDNLQAEDFVRIGVAVHKINNVTNKHS